MFIFCLFSFLMFSCSDSTAPPDNGSLDTTSHNFNWTVDTIGDGTTWLNCVSIINEDNIWIGGSINSGNSNVMHWNGKEWEYIQIRDEQYNIPLTGIEDIWAISNDNIWIGIGSIYNYDGTIANLSYLRNINTGERVTSLWYNTPDDIYGVGQDGIIVHYDGTSWQQINTNMTTTVMDIWGFINKQSNQKKILATVSTDWYSISDDYKILSIKNNSYQDTLKWKWPEERPLMSIWFGQDSMVYVAGSGIAVYKDSAWLDIESIPPHGVYKIRGSAWNNIFSAGQRGIITHYNGSTWHVYNELEFDHGSLKDLAVTRNMVVAVGTIGERGIIIRGNR
ncbi:MAG: hypothetical protein JW956_08170 [Calditrichaceae bacterium]|nr:hypothetical protein [Calditrichaceae bacterium]